jgi:hypothetical protein
MNRYFMIRRLTGPLILLLLGVIALLHQMHMARWGIFVPLLLILLGVMKLLERAALETDGAWQPAAGQAPTVDGMSAGMNAGMNAAPGSASATEGTPHENQGGQL